VSARSRAAAARRAADAVLIVLTNLPDEENAHLIAEALVAERLAACVNVLAGCRSIYRWQGEIERADEVPLLIKTTRARYRELQARLQELHPYDVPEILAWEPQRGLPAYLGWVVDETLPAG